MTLVVAYADPDYVALASDRRITWTFPDRPDEPWEDVENKAVLLHGQFLLGYTGNARLGGLRTEQWITQTLAGADPQSLLSRLGYETGTVLAPAFDAGQDTSHAYGAAGFLGTSRDEARPVIVEISNALDASGRWVPPSREFKLRSHELGQRPMLLCTYGQEVRPTHKSAYERRIREYRKNHPDKIVGVLEAMIELIRDVAEGNRYVSSSVSVAVLPRVGSGSDACDVPFGGISDPVELCTAFTVPGREEVREGKKRSFYPPAIVSRDGWVMGGAEIQLDADGLLDSPRDAMTPPP
jgi:hypothetical protein